MTNFWEPLFSTGYPGYYHFLEVEVDRCELVLEVGFEFFEEVDHCELILEVGFEVDHCELILGVSFEDFDCCGLIFGVRFEKKRQRGFFEHSFQVVFEVFLDYSWVGVSDCYYFSVYSVVGFVLHSTCLLAFS